MLLMTALWNSEHGIATRRKLVASESAKRRGKFEYHTAVVNSKGQVHVINGRNGTIRRDNLEDRARSDWEPFAPSKVGKYKPKEAKKEEGSQ